MAQQAEFQEAFPDAFRRPSAAASAKSVKLCCVDGCAKFSQGRVTRNMCVAHFKAYEPDAVAVGTNANANAASTTTNRNRNPIKSRYPPVAAVGGQRRKYCAVEGCYNQSQGRRCREMCMSHFKASTPPGSRGGGRSGGDAASASVVASHKLRKLCSVSGCGNQSQGRRCDDMCMAHYREINPDARDVVLRKLCSVDGCFKQSQGRRCNDMCMSHYKQDNARVQYAPAVGPPMPLPPPPGGASRAAGRSYHQRTDLVPQCVPVPPERADAGPQGAP